MQRERRYYVYIMSNPSLRPFYTGIANSVRRRVGEHQEQTEGSYTAQYHITRLLYFEVFHDVRNAIDREKKIKRLSRANKAAADPLDEPQTGRPQPGVAENLGPSLQRDAQARPLATLGMTS